MTINAIRNRPVVIFHGIGEPRRVLEAGERRFWLSHGKFCDILDRIAEMGDAAPEITLDDGNISDVEIALPEFEKRNIHATFFLLAGRLGCEGSLGEGDVRVLARSGQKIGLHGHDHRDWRRLDEAGRNREFRIARQRLSRLAGADVTLAAAPFGSYNRRVVSHLVAEGFEALHTSDWGRASDKSFIRPRNCLDAEMTASELENALRGHVALARRPRRLAGIARKRLLPV